MPFSSKRGLWGIALGSWVLSCGGTAVPPDNFGSTPDAAGIVDGATGDGHIEGGAVVDRDASSAGMDAATTVVADATADVASADVSVDAPGPEAGANDAQADGARDASVDVPVVPPIDASVDARDANACPVDCAHLPNVLPGTYVPCVAGQCLLPSFNACIPGFAHCSSNPNDGCETDISQPANCNYCYQACPFYAPNCVNQGGYYACAPTCTAPLQTCGFSCVDVSSDIFNCGACGAYCNLPNAQSICQQGHCVVQSCYSDDFADCTADPGCETQLGTADNCSRCGDRGCVIANTMLTCSSANNCASAVCLPGWANCNATNPDCETAFSAGGACLPTYRGTVGLATLSNGSDAPVAIGPDGSYFLGGEFSGTVDFDPTSAMDIRAAVDDQDGYITKFDANGNYVWTRTFAGRGFITVVALAVASDGAVVAVGSYGDTVDLDPGASTDLHQTATVSNVDPFVVKLAADGSFAWGKTFPTSSFGNGAGASGVGVDALGAVYVAGSFNSDIDLDPGPLQDTHSALFQSGMVVKLDVSGAFVWSRILQTNCPVAVTGLAVAADGSTWSSGDTQGCPLGNDPNSGFSPQGGEQGFAVGLGPAGDIRQTWMFAGPGDDVVSAVAVGRDGSIFVGGQAAHNIDLNPGPGVAMRWVPNSGGFIVNLGADGTFHWAQTLDGIPVGSLAPAPDGGVLAAGTTGFFGFPGGAGAIVTKLNADGSAGWTFSSGGTSTFTRSVATNGTGFAVTGVSSGSADFNPGAGIDIVFGDVTFLSRYAF